MYNDNACTKNTILRIFTQHLLCIREPSMTEPIQGPEGQHWLRLHSSWEDLNVTTLQELLEHG